MKTLYYDESDNPGNGWRAPEAEAALLAKITGIPCGSSRARRHGVALRAGWVDDRCSKPLGHSGRHSNETRPERFVALFRDRGFLPEDGR